MREADRANEGENMLKIAIVENEREQTELLQGYVDRYAYENDVRCQVTLYENGLDFISEYLPGLDIVFMDIKMPLMDGMEAAEKLRKLDSDVALVFVTNMAQLAIRGYKVSAMDFIVKPVAYFDFALELDKARKLADRRANNGLWVMAAGTRRKIAFADIRYIEIAAHDICIHTEGEVITFRGSLKNIEEKLPPDSFSRCNSCYIVNLNYVYEVREETAVLEDGTELRISRPRKKQFLNSLTDFFAGGGIK